MRRIGVKERPLFRQKKTPKSDTLHRSKRLMSGFSGNKQHQLSSVCIATQSTLQEYDDTGSDNDVKLGHETFRLEVSYCTNRLCLWWSEIHHHLPNVPTLSVVYGSQNRRIRTHLQEKKCQTGGYKFSCGTKRAKKSCSIRWRNMVKGVGACVGGWPGQRKS